MLGKWAIILDYPYHSAFLSTKKSDMVPQPWPNKSKTKFLYFFSILCLFFSLYCTPLYHLLSITHSVNPLPTASVTHLLTCLSTVHHPGVSEFPGLMYLYSLPLLQAQVYFSQVPGSYFFSVLYCLLLSLLSFLFHYTLSGTFSFLL